MIVQDLFDVIDTDYPRILIYDFNDNVIFSKFSNVPLGKCPYRKCSVAWIYLLDYSEISLRISREN